MNDQRRIDEIANAQPPFSDLLGMRIISADAERIQAEMEVVPALVNRNGVLHGGALMGFADNLGGTASFINLAEGEGTTTIESKTNFLRAIPAGDVARADCVRLHKGRTTMVWQTTISRGDGKVAAIVMQTQMILRRREG